MKKLPKRKQIRLKGFDYSSQGCYAVTISTYQHLWLFGGVDVLNEIGVIVEEEVVKIPLHYNCVKIDNYIIMPNHIHLLITIGCDAFPDGQENMINSVTGKLEMPELKNIVGAFKAGVSRRVHKIHPNLKIWQTRYFDHIIVNEKDYNEQWDYIEANPVRWQIKYGKIDFNNPF